jgi:hypothetical protein
MMRRLSSPKNLYSAVVDFERVVEGNFIFGQSKLLSAAVGFAILWSSHLFSGVKPTAFHRPKRWRFFEPTCLI